MQKKLGEVVETDPITGFKLVVADVGPRGAVYRWEVVNRDGKSIYDAPNRTQCSSFIRGYAAALMDRINSLKRA